MAEGLGRQYFGDRYSFYSAGTVKHGLNPRALKVMEELDINIRDHYSKTLEELSEVNLDCVFTVCDSAKEKCPYLPNVKIIHVGFDDPPTITKNYQNEEEILQVYRRVRDEIKEFILKIETYLK